MLILFIAIISQIEALFLKKLKAKSLTEIFLKSARRLYLVTEARESLRKRKIGAVRESEFQAEEHNRFKSILCKNT